MKAKALRTLTIVALLSGTGVGMRPAAGADEPDASPPAGTDATAQTAERPDAGRRTGAEAFGEPAQRSGAPASADAFERSLGDFDDTIADERSRTASAGGQVAADAASRSAGAGAAAGGETADEAAPQGSVLVNATPAVQNAPPAPVEEQSNLVEGCEDADRVARQLCEAAMTEQDPFLRAALRDEYNEYRKTLPPP